MESRILGYDDVAVFVAADVGKSSHHFVAQDRSGRRLLSRTVPQDETAVRELIAGLKRRGPVLFVVDQPATIGALPIAAARAEGVLVGYLPGLAMRRIADTMPGQAKTDARDAAVIVTAARTMPHTLRSLDLATEDAASLQMLCGFDDDLTKQTTKASNQLRGLLTQIHPALERALADHLDHPAVLTMLAAYPTPARLAEAGTETLAAVMRPHAPRIHRALATAVITALSEQTVIVAGTDAAGHVIQALAEQLAALTRQQTGIYAEIEKLVDNHPLHDVLTSMPGVGVRTCARLITEILTREFDSADHLASYAGIAPITRRSGTSIRGERQNKHGNAILKRSLFLSSFAALRDPESRTYYDKKIAQGKHHNQAMLALSRRRITVLYAMIRDHTPYQSRTPNTA